MLTYIRQLGEPHETREQALDTLAGALAIENIHFGFVDSRFRVVLFADCGDYTRGLSKDQMLVDGALGKKFDRSKFDQPIVMIAVKRWARHQQVSTLELMATRSDWLLFAHEHPNDPTQCILYLPVDHQIGGITQEPVEFELKRVCREVSKKAL